MNKFDATETQLLALLQEDATHSIEALAERVHLSRNACWRRAKALEAEGVIEKRVALLNAESIGCGLTVLVSVRTGNHDVSWLKKFRATVTEMPEFTNVYRTSGDVDYLLVASVADVAAYDALYQRLITKVPMLDVSASFVMEEIKSTTSLPLQGNSRNHSRSQRASAHP